MGWLLISFTTEELIMYSHRPHGQLITPSRIYSESPCYDQSSIELLQSISTTISEVKMQLSTSEEKTRKRDEASKHL